MKISLRPLSPSDHDLAQAKILFTLSGINLGQRVRISSAPWTEPAEIPLSIFHVLKRDELRVKVIRQVYVITINTPS